MLSTAILGVVAAAGATAAAPLEALRWKSRLLLVFPQHDTMRQRSQRIALSVEGLADRDLLVLSIPESGDVDVPGIGTVPSASIRAAYRIGEDSPFTVLLVGKDGGVKQRSSEPISSRDLFATIDAMPMRRQEMRKD